MKLSTNGGLLKCLAAGFAMAALGVSAVNMDYTIGSGSVAANTSGSGLQVSTDVMPWVSDLSFDLDDGESYTFGFFRIWTDESSINADDQLNRDITATLNFTVPEIGVDVDGITFGGTAFFGMAQYGKVEWNGPVEVTVGGYSFEVSLSDEYFNTGFLGLDQGRKAGAKVSATITQVGTSSIGVREASSQLPDGGLTVALLGLGLAALGGFTRTLKS